MTDIREPESWNETLSLPGYIQVRRSDGSIDSLPAPGLAAALHRAAFNWRWNLSRFVPVRMDSLYGTMTKHGTVVEAVSYTSWWQWRGRILLERTRTIEMG